MSRFVLAVLFLLLGAVSGCGQGPPLQSAAPAGSPAGVVDDGREGSGGITWETRVVTSVDLRGWAFQVVDPQGSPSGAGVLAAGPGAPPRGAGSAHLSTGSDGDQGIFLSNSSYAGERLSDLTALSYSTYATAWNGQQLPYLIIDLDLDGDGDIDDFLFFEPAYQTRSAGNQWLPEQGKAALNTWQTWDARAGGWWSMRGYANATPGTGVKPLSRYLEQFPEATIVNLPNGDGGVRVVVGQAGAGDVFQGYVDCVAIAFRKQGVLYDFEPAP